MHQAGAQLLRIHCSLIYNSRMARDEEYEDFSPRDHDPQHVTQPVHYICHFNTMTGQAGRMARHVRIGTGSGISCRDAGVVATSDRDTGGRALLTI